jgi:hypothetical protein
VALLEHALDAHGGPDQWRNLKNFIVHMSIGGTIFARHAHGTPMKEFVAEGCTRLQSLRFTGFTAPDRRGIYHPRRVAIENYTGEVLQERLNPRAAFARLRPGAPWDDLHLAYFCGFSTWSFITTPFLLANAKCKTEELRPYQEGAETWRRLHVRFPPAIATHARAQTFYFDDEGLLRRVDYVSNADGGTKIAHYAWAHQRFSGIVIPTLRRSLRVGSDGIVLREPPSLEIEIFDATFE